MDLIRAALDRPIAVISAVLMVLMFGVVALNFIPIQLTPDVRKPVLTIETIWFGASPSEVERELVNPQEEALKGLEGVEEMESTSEEGRARVTLTFRVSTDMQEALVLVSNRLDQVRSYPAEADRPQISTQGSDDNPIAWYVIRRLPGNDTPVHHFGDFLEDNVVDRMARIPGVAGTNFYGGSERELRVIVNPTQMAQYGLTVTDVLNALRSANVAATGGDVDEGKRSYTVRVEGELVAVDAVREVLVRSVTAADTGRVARVTIGDIAEVRFGYKEPRARIRGDGQDAVVFTLLRATGANVMEVMEDARREIEIIDREVLRPNGLYSIQAYDETEYITSAIELVQQNIWVGGLIAATILLLFLRSGRATLVVTLAIPVSVIGSFVAMAALGRSINVISLAGLAFAVGMVVDAAIVVLENIYRLRQEGRPIKQAAYEGARQVWGAVLVSALTTVMVFIPILTLELEVGQLFRDIAVAISVSVLLSLIVAVTLIPALANWLMGQQGGRNILGAGGPVNGAIGKAAEPVKKLWRRVPAESERIRLPVIDDAAIAFRDGVIGFTRRVVGSRILSLGVAAGVIGTMAMLTYVLLPKLEYLPTGNRNLVFGISLPPPGYNLDTTATIAQRVEAQMRELFVETGTPEAEAAAEAEEGPPMITRFFFVALPTQTFIGAVAANPDRVRELIPMVQRAMMLEPGTIGFVRQPSIFGRGIGGGRTINLDISGPDLAQNLQIALQAYGMTTQAMTEAGGGPQIRPQPGLELGQPEIRVLPDRVRLADAGVTARELANTIDVFNDGLRVVEINIGGRRMDLTLMGPENDIRETQGISNIPVVTPSGTIVPVRSLADVRITEGALGIRHRERRRTVTLQISPPDNIPLETAMEIVRNQVVAPLREQGVPDSVGMTLSGEADQLTKTWNAMVWQLLLAIVIVFLVMAVLFESFLYPFIIILSVPLATAGGILGIEVLNIFAERPQQLDMLTLLGFVILIGTVVNNAILLVHQGLRNIREFGMSVADGIVESTRTRIRPIFMSTLTSVGGMMPLVIFPGAGSELYRGLGSVVVGGLALSAILTLLIIPPLMTLLVRETETE